MSAIAPPLTTPELAAALAELRGWWLGDGRLCACYRFADFRAAMAFVVAVAADAEAQQHHPEWSNSYRTVRIGLTTHDAGGITALDVALARAIVHRAAEHRGELQLAPPTPPRPRDIPPMWFLLGLAAIFGVHFVVPDDGVSPPRRWLGSGIVVAGLTLLLWAAGLFRRVGTGVRPFTPATMLVARGPFRFSRNPMYLAMAAMLAGSALALGSWPAWLVPPAFLLLIQQRFVRREEQFLSDRFGDAYRQFCQRVRRWL